MQLLDKWFHRPSPLDCYNEVIEATKITLGNYRAEAPYAFDAILCSSEIVKKLNRISKKNLELYRKSLFLGGVLCAAWSIQRKAFWEEGRLESQRWASGESRMLDPAVVLETVLWAKDAQLQREVLLEGVGRAIVALRQDADVDLKVARDLGRSDGYPDPPAMPAAASEDEIFRVASMRVRIFWETVLPLPVYPLLAIVTRPVTVGKSV